MKKTNNTGPTDPCDLAVQLAKQIADSAKANKIGHAEMAEWAALICRMALWIYEIGDKRFDGKITFEDCGRRKKAGRASGG